MNKLKDYTAVYMIKFLRMLGYRFHIRQMIDDPRFNGNDIGIVISKDFPNGPDVSTIIICGPKTGNDRIRFDRVVLKR